MKLSFFQKSEIGQKASQMIFENGIIMELQGEMFKWVCFYIFDCETFTDHILCLRTKRINLFYQSFEMEHTMKMLENYPSWKESMRKCCRCNKLNIEIVAYYTPLKFRASYSRFKAIYEKKSADKTERWIQNQLKAFYWICVAISCVNQVRITEFSEKEWEIIKEIFYFKQLLTLEYEGKKLVDDPNFKQIWTTEEDELLSKIVQQFEKDSNKWNQFARKLFQTSQKRYYRTGKQCRERWLNHLDPSKKHGDWTKQQDIDMVKLFIKDGKKWSQIAKKLGDQRTEHMIKNRYKTILAKQRKEYPKIRNETVLFKSFLDPTVAEKYQKRDQSIQEPIQIKLEHKSQEVQLFESENQNDLIHQEESQENLKVEPSDKNLPQTSCAFELPPVYSPWYINIPITPTFSPTVPFFVNLPSSSFSAFEANYTNQFYCARNTGEKLDKPDHN